MSLSLNGSPRVHQISVSKGGVPKLPVLEAKITAQGVEGDRQRNLKVHGGPYRAVCLYSLEVIQALQAEGHPIAPGTTGENITVAGIDWLSVRPGDRFSMGPVLVEVLSYTAPCRHNARWFASGTFGRISHTIHPGWSRVYARVLSEGMIRTGDAVMYEPKDASR